MINNIEGYSYGIPVIIAEHTLRVRNKTHKIKFIDRIYEKIYGWSEIRQSNLPEGVNVMWAEAPSGSGKVIYVRNKEVYDKVLNELTTSILKTLPKETVNR